MSNKTNVRVDKELYQGLIAIREALGIPVAESIRRAIKDYIEKYKAVIDSHNQTDSHTE